MVFTVTVTEVENFRYLGLHLVGFMTGQWPFGWSSLRCVHVKEWQKRVARFYCVNDRERCRFYPVCLLTMFAYTICHGYCSVVNYHGQQSVARTERKNGPGKGITFVSYHSRLRQCHWELLCPIWFTLRFLVFSIDNVVLILIFYHNIFLFFFLCYKVIEVSEIIRVAWVKV